VLVLWWPLRQRLGVGTVANAVLVGIVIDAMLAVAHPPHALWLRGTLVVVGVIGNGFATGLYVGAELGPGARDGLSIGIAGHGHSMRVVRTTVEATVLVTGILLGGTFGNPLALTVGDPARLARGTDLAGTDEVGPAGRR